MTTALEAPTAVESLTRVRDLSAGIAGRAGAHDADGSFPTTDLSELRSAGLLGLMVPRRLGGRARALPTTPRLRWHLGQPAVRPR
jgi:alkylation response protein AidB-like acyl-CoA dehydrogenase